MIYIVPLAGPDIVQADGTIKPLINIKERPLIDEVVKTRIWWREQVIKSEDIIFILRSDIPEFKIIEAHLQKEYCGCSIVFINKQTRGALLTALVGAALAQKYDEILCVDLVDIIYDMNIEAIEEFITNPELAGMIPWFKSNEPCFSYLEINEQGHVTKTKEKAVISKYASAGTYFYKNIATFIEAVLYSLKHEENVSYKNSLFLCPSYNGIIRRGGIVTNVEVKNINALSKFFH